MLLQNGLQSDSEEKFKINVQKKKKGFPAEDYAEDLW